jgi:hypothetical protein
VRRRLGSRRERIARGAEGVSGYEGPPRTSV